MSRAKYPFEVTESALRANLDAMVEITFESLQSQFLVLPKGSSFVDFERFNDAYETLKRETSGFSVWTCKTLWEALLKDFLCFSIIRTILGFTPPEWADLAREGGSDVPQGAVRILDTRAKTKRDYLARIEQRGSARVSVARIRALIATAEVQCSRGPSHLSHDTIHRLDKVDTAEGAISIRHAATSDVPYSVLLYERFLGRPFASHRDAVSELIGDIMENAIEQRLVEADITFRKTRRAERVPGFDQAPDFFVPSEFDPRALIEAKITGDDGTARDKVTRILRLATMSQDREKRGEPGFQVIACIDGRGFGVRKQDMRAILIATGGKVFTLATLDHMITHTVLADFARAD